MRKRRRTMKKITRKVFALFVAVAMAFGLCACAATIPSADAVQAQAQKTGDEVVTYTIGIYNYLSDKSTDTVVENLRKQLEAIGEQNNIRFEVIYEFCNADPEVLDQVVAKYINDEVDLMIGIATPAVKSFEILTSGVNFPVIFAALSDPQGAGLVKPGVENADIMGVINYIDMNAAMNLFHDTTPNAEMIEKAVSDFVLSGTIEKFGNDFANLGISTANMTKSILVDGNNPANMPLISFENGNVTISPELGELLGVDSNEVGVALEPLFNMIGSFEFHIDM